MPSENSLKIRLQEDMKTAMRSQDKARLCIIRLMLSDIKQKEIDGRSELDNSQILIILDKMLKQRRESIQQYEKGRRFDLADQEKYEISIIQTYMPEPLSENELNLMIEKAVSESQAKTLQEMSKVMAIVKPLLQGRAEMSLVSQKIKQRLSEA